MGPLTAWRPMDQPEACRLGEGDQRSGVLRAGLLRVSLDCGVQDSCIGVEDGKGRGVPLKGWKPRMWPQRNPGWRGGGLALQSWGGKLRVGWTDSW